MGYLHFVFFGHLNRMRRTNWWSVSSLLIVIIGVSARLIGIDYSLDGDEVFLAALGALPPYEVLQGALNDRTHGPVYIFLLAIWIRLFGDGEFALRSLSVLFSIGFLLVVRTIAREWLKQWPGLMFIGMCALGSFFVMYGQQARPYALSLLLCAVSLLYFLRLLSGGFDCRNACAWGVAGALAVWTSYLLVVYMAVQALFLLKRHPSHGFWLLLPAALSFVPIIGWLGIAFGRGRSIVEGFELIRWIARPTELDLGLFYVDVIGALPHVPLWLSLGLLFLFSFPLGACLFGMRLSSTMETTRDLAFRVTGMAVLPVVMVFAASHVMPTSIWATRQLSGPALAMALAMALGFNRVEPRWAKLGLAVVIIWSVAALPATVPQATKPPWKKILESHAVRSQGAMLLNPVDGYIVASVRRYLGEDRLCFMPLESGSAAQSIGLCRPSVGLCRPLRTCDAMVQAARQGGLEIQGEFLYTWNSFGLVGDRRLLANGERVSWHSPGGSHTARLVVLTFVPAKID